jgi:hypothetical protein
MKQMALGTLGFAVLVMFMWGRSDRADLAIADSVGQSRGDLITLSNQLGEDRTELTVIDPRMRVIGVYHIDHGSGEIGLKSVRNINWDLQMIHFQSGRPLPQEIRSLLEQN